MAHIADLHNNGRCGQLRTVESARGAYADLIRKELKAVDSASRRDVILTLGVACPRCALVVSSARCGNCRYFPVPLPHASDIDRIVAQRKQRPSTSKQPEVETPAAAIERLPDTLSSSERLEKLQKLILQEREQKIAMLERVKHLSSLVGKLDGKPLR